MNKEKNIFSLNYGNIVKIVDEGKKYENALFFVKYIDKNEIVLLSNNFKELKLILDKDGNISSENIENFIIIYNNNDGYAKINNLLPGKKIQITFNDQEKIEGTITNLLNDMIVVDVNNKFIYIDFHYSGIDKSYNIDSINIIDSFNSRDNNFINQDNEEDKYYVDDDEEESEILIYTIEQQIDDFIDKMFLTNKNKTIINREIKKYIELLNKCSSLEDNIKIKQLSNNQILETFLEFNKNIIMPVTSYVNKDIYLTNETGEIEEMEYGDDAIVNNTNISKSINSKNIYSIFDELEENKVIENYFLQNVKTEKYHNKIKLIYNSDIMIIDKTKNIITGNVTFHYVEIKVVKNKGKKEVIEELKDGNYDILYFNKGDRFIINGIVLKDLNSLNKKMNTQESKTILNKCLDNNIDINNPEIINLTEKKILTHKIFNKNKYTYYELKDNSDNLKDYISKLNYNFINAYEDFFNKTEINMYDFIEQCSLFNVNELNKNDNKIAINVIKNNIKNFKKLLLELNNKLLKINIQYFKNISSNKLFNTIVDEYNIEDSENKQINEIFENAIIDNYNLIIFQLIKDNEKLIIDFNEEEVDTYINELKRNINDKSIKNNTDIYFSKIYETTQDMQLDNNKIILKNNLKDTPKGEIFDVVDYLYRFLMTNTKYKDSVDKFIPLLNKILQEYEVENTDKLKNSVLENNDNKENIFFTLIKKITEYKVREYDKCFVKNEKKIYVYDGNSWILNNEYKNDVENKKILRMKNSIDNFNNIKKKIADDYVISLIQRSEKDADLNLINDKIKIDNLKQHLIQLKNNKFRNVIKYNSQKNKYNLEFMKTDHLTNIVNSPFITILYKILAIDNLEEKYKLIEKFILLFTVDNNDPFWYYCIKTNTKILPKYLHKLSEAYLLFNNYENTINTICLEEGFLSENGDKWIHKESGYVIKNIEFDDNYGYDENGFKIVNDTMPDEYVEVDYDDTEDIELLYNTESNQKMIIINKLRQVMIPFMNILGVSFSSNDDKLIIYNSLYNIFDNSLRKNKTFNKYNESTIIYTIVCFLLVFVQTRNVYIKKTFPGCSNTFEGFPLDENEENISGINTFSCILVTIMKEPEKISMYGNYTESIYETFKEHNKKLFKDEILIYMKKFVITNSYINELIIEKRNKIENSKKIMEFKMTKPPYRFKPILYDINTSKIEDTIKTRNNDGTIYAMFSNNILNINLFNTRLQEFINKLIENEDPLLTTQYEEPFLINYCCNSEEYLLQYLSKNKEDSDKLNYLIGKSNELFYIAKDQKNLFFTTRNLRTNNYNIENVKNIDNNKEYDKETIYSFIIKHLNFDNDRDIPKHFLILNISKPDDSYYNSVKQADLQTKIKVLEDNNYNFTNEIFVNVLNIHNENIYSSKDLTIPENNYILDVSLKETEEKITQLLLIIADKQEKLNKLSNNDDKQNLQAEIDGYQSDLQSLEKDTTRSQINEEQLLYSKFKSTFLDTPIDNMIDNFDSHIIKKTLIYENFVKNRLNKASFKKFSNIQSYIQYEDDMQNNDKQLIINNLYNINYILITFIPNFYLNNSSLDNIVHDHWNLADKHIAKLNDKYKEYIDFFNYFEINDDNYSFLSKIKSYIQILKVDIYKNDNDIQYYFMKYLLYDILNLYINNENITKEIIEMNTSIINFISYFLQKINFDYKNIKKMSNQFKNAEKKKKTDYLKKMQKIQRDVEKYKMSYKLGDWSYGNQKRVFKYYKDLYEKEEITANKIKDTMNEMYTMVESQNISNIPNVTTDQEIMRTEADNITLVANDDGEVFGENGEVIEDYE